MFVGIDIGGTKIKGILVEKTGKEMSFKEMERRYLNTPTHWW